MIRVLTSFFSLLFLYMYRILLDAPCSRLQCCYSHLALLRYQEAQARYTLVWRNRDMVSDLGLPALVSMMIEVQDRRDKGIAI